MGQLHTNSAANTASSPSPSASIHSTDSTHSTGSSRRDFLKTTGAALTASALAGTMIPAVHAAQDSTIQIALIGCGGRGTGAAQNALQVQNGPIKLVAMADVFEDRLNTSFRALHDRFEGQMDVPPERRFISFEGYKQAIDCLRPGDVAIFATPPAFRWVHFQYAIEKGVNVFMEKPVTVDGPSTRKMLALAEKATQKNLKVGVGLMCRHCKARQELFDRIQSGQLGELITLRCYRMHPPVGSAFSPPRHVWQETLGRASRRKDGPAPMGDVSEVAFQIRRFHSFLWASGGLYSDFYIHNIDECCWMKNAWPVQAQATGGRHYRNHATPPEKGQDVDQNFDSYSVEYTFADGTKLFLYGRTMVGCHDEFASYAHGSKGLGIISTSSHTPARCRIYKGQKIDKDDLVWAYPQPEPNPYGLEWEDLIRAIRQDQPYNEVVRGAQASLVTAMGRMAAHTGQVITYDDMLNCPHEFAPDVDKLTMDGPAPLKADAQGRYPVPMPGILTDREYA
jgi:predicted dehydrogenase